MKFKFLLFILLILVGCEEDPQSTQSSENNSNTLDKSSLNSDEGNFSDYFFDLSKNIDIKYLYFQKESPSGNTILNPSLLKHDQDILNLKTFPDHILVVSPDDIVEQTTVLPFDESNSGSCTEVGSSCPDIDGDGEISSQNEFSSIPQVDSLIIYSHQFSSISKLEWDTDDNRYKPVLEEFEYENGGSTITSQWLYDLDTVYVDTSVNRYDSLVYVTPLDTLLNKATGQFYFDVSEFVKRDSIYSSTMIPLSKTFEFTRNVLAVDSIMFRVNTDCDLNGEWTSAENKIADYNGDGDSTDIVYEFNDINSNGILDEGENEIFNYCGDDSDMADICYEFEDSPNNKWDDAEVFWDVDGDGEKDGVEPFEDLNCNGEWDDAESYTDANGNGQWDEGEDFVDVGNNFWDGDEYYEDANENEAWDVGEEMSQLFDAPVNLLVDYSDTSAVGEVSEGTSITLRNGDTYVPIVEESIVDEVEQYVSKVDSVRTTFSNEIIAQIQDSIMYNMEFNILKYEFPYTNTFERKYGYSILNIDNEITSLAYKSYFKPYGFYFQPSEIAGGFWFESNLSLDTLYFTYDGKLRDGESVQYESVHETSNGNYLIEVDYSVSSEDQLIVPMRKILFDSSSGTCFNDVDINATENETCIDELGTAAFDSTVTNLFKITKITTMTMVGSGVEYGERTTSYLCKNLGIVKQKLEIRWSERVGATSEVWHELSDLQMSDIRMSQLERSRSILDNLTGVNRLSINELQSLEGDPFIKQRTAGISPVNIKSGN